jgi:hypothetical protein
VPARSGNSALLVLHHGTSIEEAVRTSWMRRWLIEVLAVLTMANSGVSLHRAEGHEWWQVREADLVCASFPNLAD